MPRPALPLGGGALRGIGESFAANAFTGTGRLTVPVPLSPARALTPDLELTYDSGAGNGPFGLGFTLSVPHISRRTDRGVPEYDGAGESDTFVLAEAEDLVPVMEQGPEGLRRAVHDTPTHLVYPYRPRVEADFSRIERWVERASAAVHWLVTSRDNVVSVFGDHADARVFDPDRPHRVLRWWLERRFDDRGNEVRFEYVAENLEEVDTTALPERARLARTTAQAQRYLKRIRYGNRVPDPQGPADFVFEVVLDYGEHGFDTTTGQVDVGLHAVRPWPARSDTFSSFRGGFDVRTRRLCRRVLLFHRFQALSGQDSPPRLVRSLDLAYDQRPNVTLLTGVTQRGYVLDELTGHYDVESLPEVQLAYRERVLSGGTAKSAAKEPDPDSLADLRAAVGDGRLRLVDLDGDGLPGLLLEQGGALYFKKAMGGGRYAPQRVLGSRPAQGAAQGLLDLDGDGQLELVIHTPGGPWGSYRRDNLAADWDAFRQFATAPRHVTLGDPDVDLVDLSGDGLADLLHTEERGLSWYRSRGRDGWDDARPVVFGEEGPQWVRNDRHAGTAFTDMSGDGLADLVLVTAASVCYWPNLGHGRWGRRVTMANAPFLGATFDPRRLRFADVDGTGPADLVYLGEDGASLFCNNAGNGFSGEIPLRGLPAVHSQATVEVADVHGTGTATLVWSSTLSTDRGRHVRALDLLPEGKPYLLTGVTNGLGLETRVHYTPSTRFSLADRAAGRPWATRLAFPVQVIDRIEVSDHARGHRLVSTYSYHHGYFDGPQREFRGFGRVDQRDSERFDHHGADTTLPTGHQILDQALHVPPVLTRTWFHTGAHLSGQSLTQRYAAEYWHGDGEAPAPLRTSLPSGMRGDERCEALRALRGRELRQEIFAEDGTPAQSRPYLVTEYSYELRMEQPKLPRDRGNLDAGRRLGVFSVHDRETRTHHYEREPDDPRLVQELVLAIDEVGNVLRSADVAYPRRRPQAPAHDEQGHAVVVVGENDWANQSGAHDATHRLGSPVETRSWELTGFPSPDPRSPWTPEAVNTMVDEAGAIGFEEPPGPGLGKRLLERRRTRYWDDDLQDALPHGQVGRRALVHERWTMAFSAALVAAEVAGRVADLVDVLTFEGGYRSHDAAFWTCSAHSELDPDHFFVPVGETDAFGNATTFEYDADTLLITRVTDPAGNQVTATHDYRALQPNRLTDANGNRSFAVYDPLARVTAIAIGGKEDADDPVERGDTLDHPTRRFVYDASAWVERATPVFVHAFAREQYSALDEHAPVQERFVYSDGSGNVLMEKTQAEPGLAPARDADGQLVLAQGDLALTHTGTDPRWIGTGRTILDNKGNPIKQYEPYFSDGPAYEDEAELVHLGVSPLSQYDPLGRLVRIDHPDGSFERSDTAGWHRSSWDRNDTVLDSRWHAERIGLPPGSPGRRAAELTEAHAGTPTIAHHDTLGRDVVVVEHLRDDADQDQFLVTRSLLDVQGDVVRVVDPAGNTAYEARYDMLGRPLAWASPDSGERTLVATGDGQPLRAWDARGTTRRWVYDTLRRATHAWAGQGQGETLVERTLWGEAHPQATARNLRGRIFRVYDGAGALTHDRFDFAGHLTSVTRRLTRVFDAAPHWLVVDQLPTDGEGLLDLSALAQADELALEVASYTVETAYDALDRLVTQTTPDGSVVHPGYSPRNLLDAVHVALRGETLATAIVTDVGYDAKGQRLGIAFGSGAHTAYSYDPLTFRLARLVTTRTDGATLQGLAYTYDPVGNVVAVHDDAQQDAFFANAVVPPNQRFVYDASYRLVEATGREHVHDPGQPAQRDQRQLPARAVPYENDPNAVRRYHQHFRYDPVGNLLRVQHVAPSSGLAGQTPNGTYTRGYTYGPGGNRLLATSRPGDVHDDPITYSAAYTYDANGNMTSMPHLEAMESDHADRLRRVDLGGGGEVFYQYAVDGTRTRKVRRNQTGTRLWERIYVGTYELYRERPVDGDVDLERETLHVGDDETRFALAETVRLDEAQAVPDPEPAIRFQHGNHLGSASLETGADADIISYEEFHPYGTTSYQAHPSAIESSRKRYRWLGKERDEETGLSHLSARLYAPWLGRWTSPDPAGLADGLDRYAYAHANPVSLVDVSGTVATAPPGSGIRDALDVHDGGGVPPPKEASGPEAPKEPKEPVPKQDKPSAVSVNVGQEAKLDPKKTTLDTWANVKFARPGDGPVTAGDLSVKAGLSVLLAEQPRAEFEKVKLDVMLTLLKVKASMSTETGTASASVNLAAPGKVSVAPVGSPVPEGGIRLGFDASLSASGESQRGLAEQWRSRAGESRRRADRPPARWGQVWSVGANAAATATPDGAVMSVGGYLGYAQQLGRRGEWSVFATLKPQWEFARKDSFAGTFAGAGIVGLSFNLLGKRR